MLKTGSTDGGADGAAAGGGARRGAERRFWGHRAKRLHGAARHENQVLEHTDKVSWCARTKRSTEQPTAPADLSSDKMKLTGSRG